MQRRIALMLIAGVLAGVQAGVQAGPAAAQDWPLRPVKVIVPFGPGSTPDIVARLVADQLQQTARAALRRREQGRRQRQHRHRRGRQGGAGRLHNRHQHRRSAGDQPLLFAKLPYDPAKDIAFDHADGRRSRTCSRSTPASSVNIGAGADRAAEGQSRQVQLSARSATARCRTSRWKRSCWRAGRSWCTFLMRVRRRR